MNHFLQKIASAMAVLLFLCLPLWAVEYVAVSPDMCKIQTDDAGGEKVSRISLLVYLEEGQAPNGQAQLRSYNDEHSPVKGEVTILRDDVLKQGKKNPKMWYINWLNVKPGKYKVYFQQMGGAAHVFLKDVEVKEVASPAPPKISTTVRPATCSSKGAVVASLVGGKAPYQYKAWIHKKDGSQEIRTNRSNDRGWTIDELDEGVWVKVEATDAQGRRTSGKKPSEIESVPVKYYPDGTNHFVRRTGKDSFEHYYTVKIDCADKLLREEAIDMLAKTIKMRKEGSNDAWVPLEYAPVFTYEMPGYNGQYLRLFFRVPLGEGKLPPATDYGSRFEVKYDTPCGEKKGSIFVLWNTKLSEMVYINTKSYGTPTDDCGWNDTKYVLNYHFRKGITKPGRYLYFFMDQAHRYASIYKRNADGSYPEKPIKDKVELWTDAFDIDKEFNVALPSAGVYKMVYAGDNPLVDFEIEFAVPEPRPRMSYYSKDKFHNFYQRKVLGIHGNTAGIVFSATNVKAPFQVTIIRDDGKKEFPITNFCDDHEYKKTIVFPQTIDFTKDADHYCIGDLPKGGYLFEIKDRCGRKDTLGVVISEVMSYKLRRDNGYNEGVLAEYSCNNQHNRVSFDYGVTVDKKNLSGSPLVYGYVTKNTLGSATNDYTYQTSKPEDIKDDVYLGVSYYPTIRNRAGVSEVKDEEVYSAIAGEFRTYSRSNVMNLHANDGSSTWTPRDTPDPYWARSYHFAFNESSAKAFDVMGASCDNNPNSGVISASMQKGKMVSMPVVFELYRADQAGSTQGSAIKSKKANTAEDAYVVWDKLAWGTYAVKITYGSGGACNMKQVVDVRKSELPQPSVVTEQGPKVQSNFDIDLADGMKPLNLFIPISPYIYDVEWYDISDGKNELKEKGNNIYVSFDRPGVYTYEIRTRFSENMTCAGSSGGTRLVKFNVTKNIEPNYWMGSTDAATGTNFSIASNWTANKVPTVGEGITFATERNNKGKPAVNDCRLTTANGMPMNFTAGYVHNESAKALIIPSGSGLYITNGMVGFEHQRNNDGKYDPVRLKIEAGTNGRPNGTFAAYYNNVENDKIYAEVQMNVKAKKVEQEWTDDLAGSPTFGKKIPVTSTDQFFGIPFKHMSAAQFAKSRVFIYNEAHNAEKKLFRKFEGMGPGEPMVPFKGYSIRRDEPKTMTLRGYLNFGDAKLELTRKAAKVQGATGEESFVRWGLGQNLFGNSYTAPITISRLDKALGDELDKTVYIYNAGSAAEWTNTLHDKNASGAGSYTAIPVKLAAALHLDEIPSMQGFLLKFNKENTVYNEAATQVNIDYDKHVSASASISQKAKPSPAADEAGVGVVILRLLGPDVADKMWLCETGAATEGYDNGYDGEKLGGEMMKAAIYSKTRAGMYQVNATNDLTKANITVKVSRPGTYTITASRRNLPQYEDLKLVDYESQMIVPFDGDTLTYRFVTDGKMMNPNRFVLMNTRATKWKDIANGVEPALESLTGEYLVYDLSGVQMKAIRLPEQKAGLKKNLAPGVYIVTKKDGTDKTGTKMVITQ